MSRVKQKDTKPEMVVRRLLHSLGFRYRLHKQELPGKPDITLPKYKVVILVHGCFWHGHNCPRGKPPDSRKDFWLSKINNNRARDQSVVDELTKLGYRVMVVWECETRNQVLVADRLLGFIGVKTEASRNGSTVTTRRPGTA